MPEITGFIGPIGGGKDYQKNLKVKEGFVDLPFKVALIEMVEDLVGFKITDNYDLFKETVLGCSAPAITDMPPDLRKRVSNRFLEQFPQAVTGRVLLQRLGTEVMRKRDPDYWVKAWADRAHLHIRTGRSVACADVRFENEVQAIWNLGRDLGVPATIIFCNYKSDRYNEKSPHESEQLAQHLIARGLVDGQAVTPKDLPLTDKHTQNK